MIRKRILIVEDEQVVAEQLQQTLSQDGYEVVGMAYSGEDAITQGRQTVPDLVVMDIVLSGTLDGITAAQQLQPLGIPVLYLTAYSDRHLLDRAQLTQPLAYVIKPAKTGELTAAIEIALFKREQERDRERNQGRITAEVREADQSFRRMVAEVTEVAIYTLDVRGNVKSWNRGAETINGYRAEEIIGKPYALLFTPEDRLKGIPQTDIALAERDGTADNTRWLVRQNGEHYWAEGVLTAIRDGAGTLTGFTTIARDATEHKKTKEELDRTQEKLRVALRAARMGTWDWNIKKNQESLDENLKALFGLRPEHPVDTIEDFYSLVHPNDRPNVIAAFEQTRHEHIHLNTEFRVTHSDGSQRWLLDQGEVLLDEQGIPERLTGACVDITERKQAEEALRQSEERFRLFVNGVRDYALFQMNENGRIVTWNAGAERLLGYQEDEIVGQPSAVIFTPEDRAEGAPQQEIDQGKKTGRAEDERWHVRKDGTRFWCSGVLARIDDAQGNLRGFAKVMRDETERRRSSDQLTSSLAEKEVLLKEIHHRVKNNLQVITSLLTLQSDTVPEEGTRQIFAEAVNRVRTIGDIHDLLYLSPDLARIDFNDYLDRLTQNLLSFYGIDRNRIRVSVSAKSGTLDIARAIPCGLIVNELLTNALKHAFPNDRSGEIRVSIRSEGTQCLLEVYDNGIGLPDDALGLKNASLGLRLVTVLARQIQGELRINKNGWTGFEISFPCSATGRPAEVP